MIQFLRGAQSQLQSSQQIFAAGQPIFESDTGQLKIGDGIRTFANLPYVGKSSSSEPADVGVTYTDDTSNAVSCISIGSSFRIIKHIRTVSTQINQGLPYEYFRIDDNYLSEYSFRSQALNGYVSYDLRSLPELQDYLLSNILDCKVFFHDQGSNSSSASTILMSRLTRSMVSFKSLVTTDVSSGPVSYEVELLIYTCNSDS